MPVPPRTESHKWSDGDFTLISSDNVVFKIDSFHLFAASVVFRTHGRTNNAPIPQVVEFTDDDLESSIVIDDFLTLISSGTLEWSGTIGRYETVDLSNLMAFLPKYDCQAWVGILLDLTLQMVADHRCETVTLFVLGAQSDRSKYCVASLKSPLSFWRPGTMAGHRSVSDRDSLDPSAMPFEWFRSIPSEYLWALCRAWDLHRDDRSLIGSFTKFLAAAKGEFCSDNDIK